MSVTAEQVLTFCTFRVDNLLLGVPVAQVQELVRHNDLTPVPLAPPSVVGLINLRGRIVTAVALRPLLGRPPAADRAGGMNVVVQNEGGVFSLVVDRIGDILSTSAPLGKIPDTLTGVAREVISGVHQGEDHLLLVLDVPACVRAVKS